MDSQATAVFLRFFTGMKDPRRHNRRHLLSDILTITILAMMCGSDDWPQVVEWAKARHAWLAEFLPLPSGLPGEDTFRRVLARIDPLAFEQCFQDWTRAVAECSEGQVVSFDGKTMRGSFGCGKQGMTHLVSAWCTHNRLVLGQLAVEDKSNEIIAIPKLLELLNLKGAIVTIDAMGCQRAIAQKIRQKEADYVLAVKDNQPALCQKMDAVMQDVILDLAKGLPVSCGYDERTSGGHGRIETRRVWVSDEVEALGPELLAQWPDLRSMAVVECHRRDLSDPGGKTSVHRRLFISSLAGCDAARMARVVRAHWGVENGLHWRLDVSMGEDKSRQRAGHEAENFSRVRRIVLNKLKIADPRKLSLKLKRYRCSIDPEHLQKILQA